MNNPQAKGYDTGYVFSGPHITQVKKTLKTGITWVDNVQQGVMVSENPNSPWYQATFLSHGTTLIDAEGKVLGDVALCEMTDPDGDTTWMMISWWYAEGPGQFQLVQGTGKWEGITGKGKTIGSVRERNDDHFMPEWEMNWEIKPGVKAFSPPEGTVYTDHDVCLSFHGPHVTESTKVLKNGHILIASHQAGVLLSDNREAVSPRILATCFDLGTTIQDANGKTLGDVMLLEDQDPDGDFVWLCHVWWYGKGPGWYRFIGGTGKWKGIQGEGITQGMLAPRVDDHYMLKSEIHWCIKQ